MSLLCCWPHRFNLSRTQKWLQCTCKHGYWCIVSLEIIIHNFYVASGMRWWNVCMDVQCMYEVSSVSTKCPMTVGSVQCQYMCSVYV